MSQSPFFTKLSGSSRPAPGSQQGQSSILKRNEDDDTEMILVNEEENEEVGQVDENDSGASSEQVQVSQTEPAAESVQLDFRDNVLPPSVEVIGCEKAEFIIQKDGSSALRVPPGCFLRVNSGLKSPRGKLLNDYTLTMDVLFEKLPSESASLFQSGSEGKMSEGEAFVYSGGGVGVFGEVGVPEAAMRENKWTRVVITLGGAQSNVRPRTAANRFPGRLGMMDSTNDMGMEYGDGGSHFRTSDERLLTTYVNSRKCAVVSSNRRGIIGTIDGRMAINPQSLLLFGSNREAAMPGCLIRYAELKIGAMTDENVRVEAQRNRIYSSWEKDRKEELQRLRENLTLSGLFKRPPPIWVHPSVLAEFGDAFLEGSGLEGGDLPSTIAVFSLLLERILLNDGLGVLGDFGHEVAQSINAVVETVKSAKNLFRQYGTAAEQGGGAQFIHFIKRFKTALVALPEGHSMIVPGGIGPRVVVYIIERESENVFRFSVVNTDPTGGLEFHLSTASTTSRIQFQTILSVKGVSSEKMLDDAFWAMLFKLALLQSKHNTTDKLYDLLLPFLVDKPLEQIVAESSADIGTSIDWRHPQRAAISAFRSMMECVNYLLRRRGLSVEQCRKFFYVLRYQIVLCMEHDLAFVRKIRDSDRRIVSLCCQQLAYVAAKLGEERLLVTNQLNAALNAAERVNFQCFALPCEDADVSASPPLLYLEDQTSMVSSSNSRFVDVVDCLRHPFLDRLVRDDDVNGLAGAPIVLPKYVPIDYFLLPKVAENLEEAVEAIRFCDRLCTLISVQGHCVKNRAHHKLSLIEHTFTHVLPMPRAENLASAQNCIWRTPMRYGVQLDLTICLGRIMEHFVSSTFSMQETKSKDALNLVITGCITALVDVILRRAATDQPSEFCLHLMGANDIAINQPKRLGRGVGYGLEIAALMTQSETLRLYTPELCVARTAVLDYFAAQTNLVKIFNWNENHRFEPSVAQFLGGICADLAFPQDEKSFVGYMTSRSALINKNYPEFHVYRDCAFFMKFMQNVDPRAFPPKKSYSQQEVELNWGFQEGAFIIEAFMRGFSVRCYPEDPFKGAIHRYPSSANPAVLASPHEIRTEDDVLHIKNLPSFKDCIGQQDSELLLSYLTVPYLRIPLVLSLFATEDRIHSLRSEQLQEVLDAVLFEPGIFLTSNLVAVPHEVPAVNKRLLAAPFGLLLNELCRSPEVIMNSVVTLVKLAVNLDVGTVHSSTVQIVLFVLRIVARIDSAVSYVIENASADSSSSIFSLLRNVTVPSSVVNTLTEKRTEIFKTVHQKVFPMIESWCIQLSLESIGKEDDEVMDANTRIACQLHAHLLLLHRNVKLVDYSFQVASIIASSFLFLTSRHTWNLDLLGIPENELFEMLMIQRRNLVMWTRTQPQSSLNDLMEAAVRVTVGTGIRKCAEVQSTNQWAYVGGIRSVGRFTIISARATIVNVESIREVSPEIELGIEVDLQTAQLTLKSSHLQALDTAIASDPDVQMIFGKKSMQASIVESTENRLWVHLVGRDHDVHFWRTPDERTAVVELDRDYSPGELEECEQWIVPILEPVRLMYMTQPFVLQICMPEKTLPPNAQVAMLVGIHPKLGGTWKEIFVHRALGVVQVYQIMSHGRRFYRVLEYTSDVRCTLRDMQPSLDDRRQLWPVWERHGAGHPYQDHWRNPLSCVITRGSDHPKNLSGSLETLVPERLLYGTVPQGLLEQYIFWQCEGDNLNGYPRDETCPYIIEVTLETVSRVRCTQLAGVCGRITRVLKSVKSERLKDRNTLVSHFGATIKSTSTAVTSDTTAGNSAESSWSFDHKMLARMDAIVDSQISLDDVKDFIDALKASGVVYEDAAVLVTEVENFVKDNPVDRKGGSAKLTSELLEQSRLSLINIGFSDADSKYYSILKTLSRMENASYILCWTLSDNVDNAASLNIDLIELPRLKMSFGESKDEHGIPRLFSLDHVNLFVTNVRTELTAKLMQGLPHSLLMSTSNDELQVLVPAVDPVRPRIGTSPFTTELVLNRSMNPQWAGAVESTYFLYPIHVSLSFLFSPTLSSSLYLLLLRFLNRNYEEVFRLSSTIGTDIEYSGEEEIIFACLGRSNGDNHPDAHACRLKIAIVVFDSPVRCPFDLTAQMSRYITKLNHVSAVCRLTLTEELTLLETCVCDPNDARFFDAATGLPRYSLHEVTIVKNRKVYLQALLSNKDTTETFNVPRNVGTRWPCDRNVAAVMMDESAFLELEVSYSAPAQASGSAALEVVDRFFPGQEDAAGHAQNLGFLYLYELLTGTKQCKILNANNSVSIARLLFEMTSDKAEIALLPSVINLMTRFPQLIPLMPKYVDRRTHKTAKISGVGNDVDLISPLGQLLAAALQVIGTEIADILGDAPDYDDHPVEPNSARAVIKTPWTVFTEQQEIAKSNGRSDKPPITDSFERSASWIIPTISNFSCELRPVVDITPEDIGVTAGFSNLGMCLEEVEKFSASPLSCLDLKRFITFASRTDVGLSPIEGNLPFNVESHEQAKSAIAQSMLSRLTTDMHEFASVFNTEKTPKLSCLLPVERFNNITEDATLSSSPEFNAMIVEARNTLEIILRELESLRAIDAKYVEDALPWLLETANNVPIELEARANESDEMEVEGALSNNANNTGNHNDKLLFLLKRFSRQEVTLWLEFLFGSMLSSAQAYDLQLLNPFLPTSKIELISAVIVASIFHANRIGMINRCVVDARDLHKVLCRIAKCVETPSNNVPVTVERSLVAASLLKGESLARNMCIGRHYIQCSGGENGGESKRRRTIGSYDPRFLLFEFTWNILLRKSQVEMVLDYMNALRSGTGMVKQMIMGAGKTTVVCPLLTLMLGDGSSLIVQVVPPALLEFSRSVMRSTFSAIMQKRIFTLSFDRSSEIDPSMLKKLNMAKLSRGVVISTPTTVKSIMLKFLELLRIITDPSTRRTSAVEVDAAELGKSLTLFKESILIMDEVDLILHPMKSELNFPIGEKIELDFSPQRWQMPIHLLDSIFYAERQRISVSFKQSNRAKRILESIKEAIDEGYVQRSLQRNPHIVLLNVDWYKSCLQPLLADWLLMWLEAQHLAGLSEASIKKYLMEGANSSYNSELAESIQTKLSPNHRKMLNLGRDWLNSYLPHVLQKIDRVSFGIMNEDDYDRAIKNDPRMPRTRAKLAIPFVGKDVPSRSSEFAHPDVIIGLTILAYRYEGLRWSDFEDIMNNLRSTLIKELGPFSKRKSNIRYARWVKEAGGSIYGEQEIMDDEDDDSVMKIETTSEPSSQISRLMGSTGEKVVVSLRLLKRSNEEQMKKLYALLRKLPDTIHYYLENFIFPVYTDNKIIKLSAAGQELGGEMLFQKRIGFSGTPSDLLPVELGSCGYERCSDGQMIHVLTSPEVCSFEIVQEGWTPVSLLEAIATSEAPRYHALIDTGALITGYTNLQVAQMLLKLGLRWCEGVVYLDEYDRKMVLIRATGRVLKMSQCGVPAEKRFAFYDQVHTTGMDISHVLDAKAVLTLSKDMVFRDIAQGAYRMRGINKGQTIHVMVIPEVKDLIIRELSRRKQLQDFNHWSLAVAGSAAQDVKCVLCDINAWLVISAMRSERVQFNQLCIQNVANVYRKKAFSHLLGGHTLLNISNDYERIAATESGGVKLLLDSLQVFCEPIDFCLEEVVPNAIQFSESIRARVSKHIKFVSAEENEIIERVISWVTSGTNKRVATPSQQESSILELTPETHVYDELDRLLGAEMVQEQEQEQEQEKEQEQEQEIEIEKYVDLAYSRENEEPTPWPFSTLQSSLTRPLPQFYPAHEFKLYKRNPLQFPDYCLVSNNYFDCRWSGARRIKNVVIVLDWIPDLAVLKPVFRALDVMSDSQKQGLEAALDLLDFDCKGSYSLPQLQQLLRSALHLSLTAAETSALIEECNLWDKCDGRDQQQSMDIDDGAAPRASIMAVKNLLLSGRYSQIQLGRRFVCISLAEAETIRCIMHRRIGQPVIAGSSATIALRCVPTGYVVLDESISTCGDAIMPSRTDESSALHCPFMTDSSLECFRFLNCELFFSERSLNVILRALHNTGRRERKVFFKNVIACRRRLAKKWNEYSVAKLFTLSDYFGQLKQRATSVCLREAIQSRGMLLYDAFNKFNFSKNGLLSPAEVWGAFHYLEVEMTAMDILDFVNAADMDRDGNISFKELVDILSDPDKQGVNDEEDVFVTGSVGQQLQVPNSPRLADVSETSPQPSKPVGMKRQVSLNPVAPRGEEELVALKKFLMDQEEAAERAEAESEGIEEQRIRDELEAEEDEKDRTQPGGRNPKIGSDYANYDFATGRMPRRVSIRGDCSYREDASQLSYLKVFAQAMMMISTPFKDGNCGGRRLNQYTLTLEIMHEVKAAPPTGGQGLGIGGIGGRGMLDRGDMMEVDDAMEGRYPLPTFNGSGNGGQDGGEVKSTPIFSTALYGETEALLWLNSGGKLVIASDGSKQSLSSAGVGTMRSTNSLPSNKWSFVSLVVDCIEGCVEAFVNGRPSGKLSLAGPSISSASFGAGGETTSLGHVDGPWSLADQFSLFGTRTASECGNGAIRRVFLQTRCLLGTEVEDLVHELKRDSESGLVNEIVTQLMGMGFSADIARWAANQSEGASMEDRLNSALSILG